MKPIPGRLVLLGHPIDHSLSPLMQNAALASARIPLHYEALDVAPDELPAALLALRAQHAAGNVTMPHKAAVAADCERVTDVAFRVGGVNTFWCEGDELLGDNTDVHGFDAMVRALCIAPPRDALVAILGAGGAAAAVLEATRLWKNPKVRIWSRSRHRAEALAALYPETVQAVTDLEETCARATVVVNATPIGFSGDETPADVTLLRHDAVVMDLAYRRGDTPFVQAARARGLKAADGLTMLIEQGAAAFHRWFGIAPDREAMRAALGS